MLVLIRGAGDIATGIALRLYRSHFQIVMTDLPQPTAIRRTVAFSESILHGSAQVENVQAVFAQTQEQVLQALAKKQIPVLADECCACLSWLKPDVLVDAVLAKRNLGTKRTDAPLVIGVGPGFTAGRDCHRVIETLRGHSLGRVIREGSAAANTAVPGLIGGYTGERVLRAPKSGTFTQLLQIGTAVRIGDIAASVDGEPVVCTIDGVLRGLLPSGTPVHRGMKSGDIDPRGDASACRTVSDKALAVGGGVLEAILEYTAVLEERDHAGNGY